MLGPLDFWVWGDSGAAIRARATDHSDPQVRVTDHSDPSTRATNAPHEEDDTVTITIDGQTVERRRLYPNNAHLVKVYLEQFDATANDYAAWDDATSPAVAFCTDRLGASVISGMGPFTLTAVDATNYPGWFYYVVPVSVMALLDDDAYTGTTVYQRITAGASSELRTTTPFIVADPRFAADP